MAQRFIEASNGEGGTERFFWPPGDAEGEERATNRAIDYAQSEGGFGYIVLMERERLNDYVGSPIWSEPVTIREV